MAYLFVSDVHLSNARPESLANFLGFLGNAARRAQALYILGDVFDLWLGDDDRSPPHTVVVQALSELTRSGTPCFAMHGNHDFLLGKAFEAASGCRLLPDPTVITLYGTPVLLSHGDSFCTDDEEYQRWRAYSRNEANQRAFLASPLEERAAQATTIRKHADDRAQLKPHDIMDVNQTAVHKALRAYGVRCLVHGHTHRPGVHQLPLDGEPATRIVLGDWYARETLLSWDESGYQLGSLAELGLSFPP